MEATVNGMVRTAMRQAGQWQAPGVGDACEHDPRPPAIFETKRSRSADFLA